MQSNKKIIIRIASVFLALILLVSIGTIRNGINETVTDSFCLFDGEQEVDTNIVLITITADDIAKLSWPLKRNYYALLLDNLNRFETKAIGFEIFLSDKIKFQSIYNDLLNEIIYKNNNIVFGSLLQNLTYSRNGFSVDNITFPQPRLNNPKLKTGHLNFYLFNGISIPNELKVNGINESSFSNKIFEIYTGEQTKNVLTKLNVNSSWMNFKQFTFLEIFDLIEKNNNVGKLFKNKIVLIGVTDPSISKSISSAFDVEVPGLALHAFAVNNLLNENSINFSWFGISTFIFPALILLIAIPFRRRMLINIIGLIILFFIAFILFSKFSVELNVAFFVVPILLLFIVDLGLIFYEKEDLLTAVTEERDEINLLVSIKEKKLAELEENLKDEKRKPQFLENEIEELSNELETLKTELNNDSMKSEFLDGAYNNFEGMIYRSPQMKEVVSVVKKVSPQKATVLILGESGTGKELIASSIHNYSNPDKKFVAVNCAALSETLLESELFGHVKGAFTNAINNKKGLFEIAGDGTIFLDEIGETSENFQRKLLRVLQNGDYNKVGATETSFSKARILAASNKDLSTLVKNKNFREDLYYRLNVITISLPSLAERKEDVEPLVNYFVKSNQSQLDISLSALKKLVEHEWKGNIRELKSVIERAIIFANSDERKIIQLSDLPEEIVKLSKADLEDLIIESLRRKKFSHSSINETAKELGNINRNVVSENLRGLFFKHYCKAKFNIEESVEDLSNTKDEQINKRVKSKCEKYLENIKKDVLSISESDLETFKLKFNSKYKNLPNRFHNYLDEIVIDLLK